MQAHARRFGEPIDALDVTSSVTPYVHLDDVPRPPDVGVYIHGLFLEGARFDVDANCMAESRARGPVAWRCFH